MAAEFAAYFVELCDHMCLSRIQERSFILADAYANGATAGRCSSWLFRQGRMSAQLYNWRSVGVLTSTVVILWMTC